MTSRGGRAWVVALLLVLAGGCSTPSDRIDNARTLAGRAGLEARVVDGGPYRLQAFVRLSAPGEPLRIYIEGDGDGFDGEGQPTRDPTPADPVTLRMAAGDRAPNLAYLGRPCQYLQTGPAGCREEMWTVARLSPQVIDALDRAVETLKAAAGAPRVELIGQSGGGAAAVLVAARRSDVASLRTVAANLDLVAWTTHHRVPPLSRSLDPAQVAERVAVIPQRHFVGGRDTVVPPTIVESFVRRMRDRRCVAVERVADARHDEPWPSLWPTLLERPVTC